MPTKLVLFDLDDTLFDHDGSRQICYQMLHSDHACFAPYEYHQFERDYVVHMDETWPHVMDGSMTVEARIAEAIRRLAEQYSLSLSPTECAAMASRYRQLYLQSRRLIPGSIELLEALKPHAAIGIITNNRLDEQVEKLEFLKLEPLIDMMICSSEIGISKPDPRIFEAALQRAGFSAHEAVMIGDSWTHDVVGAATLGMRAVWLNRAHLPIPDPTLALEIHSLEPADKIARVILNPQQSVE